MMNSPTIYRAMIYAGVAIMHFYRDDVNMGEKGPGEETLGDFADRNKELHQRIFDEVMSTFGYELSYWQMGRIFAGYLAESSSLADTEPFVPTGT